MYQKYVMKLSVKYQNIITKNKVPKISQLQN